MGTQLVPHGEQGVFFSRGASKAEDMPRTGLHAAADPDEAEDVGDGRSERLEEIDRTLGLLAARDRACRLRLSGDGNPSLRASLVMASMLRAT